MSRRVAMFILFVTGSALVSCGGEPNPMGSGPDDPQITRVVKVTPSFAQDVQEIFIRTGCTDSGCHADGQGGFFLHPNDAANYANIVNVPSDTEREFFLVKPFDATNSYLVIRVENRQGVGVPMPPGTPLDNIDLTNFRNWINIGAPNN